MLSGIVHDLRFALRSFSKSPLLVGVATVSLALGIGANTAIFTLFDQVLLRLLPVEDPASLVIVATRGSYTGSNHGRNALSYPMYKDYRERNQVFDGILCRRGVDVNLGFGSGTERVEAELVSGNYFEVLGVQPALGRVFSMDDERAPGADAVVVLNYDYWRQRFSSDESMIGEAIRVNGYPMTVVGVAAPGFQGVSLGFRPKLHIPVTMKREVTPSWDDLDNRRSRWLQVLARLKDGVSLEQAEASLQTLYKQIITMEVEEPYFANVSTYHKERFLNNSHAVVLPGGQGDSGMRRTLETPLKVLMGFVGLVLFITCANVSNLLVAKATNRRNEIALRLAIGAGRRHILRQLFVESFLLALIGGLFALLVGYLTSRGLIFLAPSEEMRQALSATPDVRILGFNLMVTVVAAIGFGLVPALQALRTDLVSTIKQQSAASSAGYGSRARKTLVVVQVFVALLLIVGSGLFVQSLKKLNEVDPGFHATNLVRFKIDPMLSGYDTARTKELYARIQERLQALVGIESVGLAVMAIMEGDEWDSSITIEGYRAADDENMNPHFNSVSSSYFETLGMRIVEGRDFDSRDIEGAKRVVIVNETFAARYFGGDSPLGYHIAFGRGPNIVPNMEIVGVVEDAMYENLRDEVPRQVFVHHPQVRATDMTVYVRSSLPSEAIPAMIRREVKSLDATMPIFDMNTMEDQLDRSLAMERLVAFLASAFGILAAVLAFVGLYGVTAFGVSRRTAEIGLRIALGARGSSIIRMVLKEVLILTGIGIAIAVPSALWMGKLIESQLFGVPSRDPFTMVVAAFFLFSVTVLAGAVPALRASRLSPSSVLRYE
jgi:predicted permease